MLPRARVPLAWCNLTHDKRRFFVSLLGITFAVLLMFVELGFWNALMDAAVALIRCFNGELVLVSSARDTLASNEPFRIELLYKAKTVEGVEDAYPLYLEYQQGLWKDTEYWRDPARRPEDRDREPSKRPIRVIAFDPSEPVLTLPAVAEQARALQAPDTILIDTKSKKDYGRLESGLRRELSDGTVRSVGTFSLGTDFTTDGNVIMSDRTYAKTFPYRPDPAATLRRVNVGIVRLREGADPEEVRRRLEEALPRSPKEVVVLTRDDFERRERAFWRDATPVGFIFTFGLFMGFVVGLVICYQILSANVTDHLAEYATLKAIGYPNRYLTWVVLQEALWLSLLGFGPGVALAWGLYELLAGLTGLPLYLTANRALFILGLTTLMCTLSGCLAVRRVQTADPAEVF